jgi:hypothetical protein
MRALRRPIAVVFVLAVALASCTDEDARAPDRVETPTVDDGAEDVGGEVHDLPFGLQPVDGLTGIGRPAVSPSVDPAEAGTVQLTAAFRIDADDPEEAFEAFVAQLAQSDELGFGILSVGRADGGRADPWLIAGAGDGRDSLDLQVWTTAAQPVLLVTVIRRPGDGAVTSAVGTVDAGDPPGSPLGWDGRTAGDGLIGEQDASLHLPDGTRALMPTIPVVCGTGGSFSVLAADDGRAAVDALLAEGMASSTYGQTDGPDERVVDGVTVITADFVIMAGGWSFDVVSVRGPADEAATLYVTSCAD